ncbi:guanine nucleotide exchange factor [Moniliophthora roreri MCA 2997]|uniref:Guanine nucleotide exchange factor n=1 Tax=Moniliophthora roreri (strain MCA 2997) TaxID=1381753 RepID=V2Y0Q1_MONRO|nr:guanine nucleotide exchange factor [Moniliophthora roreri MCA 2997]
MFRNGPQYQKSNSTLRPIGPRDIRQKQQQLNHRISRTDLDFEAALQQEGTFVIKEGIDVNELGKGFDSPAPTPSRPQPATPIIVPPTPSQRLERHHTIHNPGDMSDEDTNGNSGVGGSGTHHNVNRRSMYRSPGSSSSPDLATLLRKSKERATRDGGGGGGGRSDKERDRDRDKHGLGMDRLRRVMSPSPPPFSPGDRTGAGVPPSPSPLPGAKTQRFQPNRMDTSGWVLTGSTSSASNSPGKSKSTVRSKASTFLGKMLGGNTVRERSKTDASQQNPSLLDAFNEPPLPPVPPLPPGFQNQNNNATQLGSPIADVFTSSNSFATVSSSTSKPLPPIMRHPSIGDIGDPEERSMVIVEKPPATPARSPPPSVSIGTFGKRRSMSVSDTDLKKAMMMDIGDIRNGNGNATIKGREKGIEREQEVESDGLNGVLKDLKGQMSNFDAFPVSRPSLDLKYPTSTSSPPTPSPGSPLGSRRASYKRSNTDSQIDSSSEEKQQYQQISASSHSLGAGGGLAPPSLQLRSNVNEPLESDPAPIVPPRTSSLQPSPIRSTSGPAAMTSNTPSSPGAFKPSASPVRGRIGHSSFNLPPPSSSRGLRSMHRSTASSSEPSLVPSGEEYSRILNHAGSHQDLTGSDRHDLNLTRFPSSLRGNMTEEAGDVEARGKDLAAKCWNEEEDFLAKDKIAEWLGGTGQVNKIALQYYMDYFDFSGLRLDTAFRRLCSRLYLKGETQQVDRLLEEFSRRYWDCNPSGVFGSASVVHAVTYSILLLNTDLHVADIPNRMSRNQFVKNTLGTIQMQLQPSNFGTSTSHSEMYDDSNSVKESSAGDSTTTSGNGSGRDTIRSKRSDSITSWNSISRETFMSSPALSLATTQATTPGGPFSNESTPSVLGTSQDSKASSLSVTPNNMYGRAWESTMENLLKDMYNAVKTQQILLPLNAGRASSSSLSLGPGVTRNRSLRGQPDRLTTLKRGSIRGFQSIMAQSGVSPYSSNSSIDGRVSPSPSFAASTHEVYGSSSSFLSPTLGFASNLSHTIIREAQEDDDRSAHSNGSTSTDISITDEELALLGPPWAKEGMLCRKQYWESTGKRAKDKNWLDVFVVIQKGELNMFTFGENGGGASSIVGGGNWLSNATPVGTVHLAHSLAHALPSPGYNRQRPYCMVLTLSNGGVYFFQAGTEELVNEWVSTCNYWAARTSKEPLAGGVSNMEYGWNRIPGAHTRSQSDSESVRDTDTTSLRSSRSGRSKFGWKEGGAATVRGSPWIDRIVINDWKPPMPPVVSSFYDEETQLEALRKHVKSMKRDLQRHNELREPMAALYQPRSSNAVKAQNNWEKKSQYLLTEIVKYDSYIESLQTAMALRLKKRGEKVLERALDGGGSDESRDVKGKRKADEATIHENDDAMPGAPISASHVHKREIASGGDDDD